MKIRGIVKRNLGRGKALGFPTANLDAPSNVADGIYSSLVRLVPPTPSSSPSALVGQGGEKFKALAFVGAAETFGETHKQLEVHILDFDRDLYGHEIEVKLLEKIRDNQKFETPDDLVAQMKKDEKMARKFFETYGRTE